MVLSAVSVASPLHAQEGVASSGMGQGEANISTRSDVRLGVESGPGTSGQRLRQITATVTAQLGAIRECYADVTGERPTVTGNIRTTLRLEPRALRPQLRSVTNTVDDAPLSRCVMRTLRRADYRTVERPAQITVRLEFSNTAAEGARELERREAEEGAVDVARDGEDLVARGGTPGGEVRFEVRSSGDADTAQVAAVQRSVRTNIAGLLDCRRRAGRNSMDSAGTIDLVLRIPPRGRVRTQTVTSTLEDERAPRCISRAFARARFEEEAAGTARLKVMFTSREPLDVPVRE